MTPFKLKIIVEDENGGEYYKDFYCDADNIIGFYIPNDGLVEGEPEQGINLLLGGDVFSVKQEPHIKQFLLDKFVKVALKV